MELREVREALVLKDLGDQLEILLRLAQSSQKAAGREFAVIPVTVYREQIVA